MSLKIYQVDGQDSHGLTQNGNIVKRSTSIKSNLLNTVKGDIKLNVRFFFLILNFFSSHSRVLNPSPQILQKLSIFDLSSKYLLFFSDCIYLYSVLWCLKDLSVTWCIPCGGKNTQKAKAGCSLYGNRSRVSTTRYFILMITSLLRKYERGNKWCWRQDQGLSMCGSTILLP